MSERFALRRMADKFREIDPEGFKFVLGTHALQIGERIDFENDRLKGPDGLGSFERSALRGASMTQIESWSSERQEDAQKVFGLLAQLYPGGNLEETDA